MSMNILGLGVARPPASMSQADAAKMARQRCCDVPRHHRLLDAIYRQSQVQQRGSVLLSPPMTDDRHGRRSEPDATPGQAAISGNGNGSGSGARAAAQGAGDGSAAGLADFFRGRSQSDDPGPGVGRRMEAYAARAPSLAAEAARAALKRAGRREDQVTQLVTVSCTGFFSPGIDHQLIHALGLPPTVGRTMIGFMGCHAAINGLRVADALAAADPGGCVLMCAVELCSLHFQYGWEAQRVVANALFADGAAAVMGRAAAGDPDAGDPAAGGVGEARPWRVAAVGSCVAPDSRDAMTWTIGDHGFVMTLSSRVPRLIREHLRPWLGRWLGEQGLRIEEVGSWAVHPGGPRILTAAEEALGLPTGATAESGQVLATCGNMSSPTVLFILDRLRRRRAARPCVVLAFGPGLTIEAALIL